MKTMQVQPGLVVNLAESESEDSCHFGIEDLPLAKRYYDDNGYVVLRRLIPKSLCDVLRADFDRNVRGSTVPMLRQHNMRYERHEFTADGFLTNPIFNIQDLQTRLFGGFKQAALDILTHHNASTAIGALLGAASAKLIQSMFFEAPVNTWIHQDSYYQDSALSLGGAIAGWYALEDIDVAAGRFYVLPTSHRTIPVLLNHGKRAVSVGHDTYKRELLEAVAGHDQLQGHAPFLRAGDVLFWNSLTVHGSLPALRPKVSRASLTAHYLRETDDMLQFHTRVRHQQESRHNSMKVCLLHDQDKLLNRSVRTLSSTFPAAWSVTRNVLLRALQAYYRARPDPPQPWAAQLSATRDGPRDRVLDSGTEPSPTPSERALG